MSEVFIGSGRARPDKLGIFNIWIRWGIGAGGIGGAMFSRHGFAETNVLVGVQERTRRLRMGRNLIRTRWMRAMSVASGEISAQFGLAWNPPSWGELVPFSRCSLLGQGPGSLCVERASILANSPRGACGGPATYTSVNICRVWGLPSIRPACHWLVNRIRQAPSYFWRALAEAQASPLIVACAPPSRGAPRSDSPHLCLRTAPILAEFGARNHPGCCRRAR